MSFGGLKQVADLYHERLALSSAQSLWPADDVATSRTSPITSRNRTPRARQIRYYKECVIPALPGDPNTAPPSYRYFVYMVERLQKVRPDDLTENSVLLGSPAHITDVLKKVEAAGFSEVILYFNVGMKPHMQVKEEMDQASCARSLWHSTTITKVTLRERVSSPKSSASGSEIGSCVCDHRARCVRLGNLAKRHEPPRSRVYWPRLGSKRLKDRCRLWVLAVSHKQK